MSSETRRRFLRSSALGLAGTAAAGSWPWLCAKVEADQGSAVPGAANGEISVWATSEKRRFAKQDPVRWHSLSGTPSGTPTQAEIVLNPDRKFQQILGFGAAFTDAACFMFNQLAAEKRAQLFHELFHPGEMGLSVCRTCIGASDYSTKVYSFDEGDPDPEMKRFSIEHDREYILPMLREARKVNPDLFLFSAPWSPPGWMKSGGSMLGGSMRQRYLSAYAQYFVKFLQGYAADGVPVQAVSVQNEVDTDQDGRMPACIWPQEFEIGFVKHHLGPALERNGLKTKIWVLDHNYNLWGRAMDELEDAGVRRYSNAIAWHAYVGKVEMISKVHDAHPDAEMFWTEGGPDYTSPDYQTDWAKWGETFTSALRNWCRSLTGWNLALDEHGRPNIGPFPCGGLVTIHSQTKEITRSGQYWAFAHFSRTIRRGAVRFDSEGAAEGINHAAFENPDGTRALVITNAGPARTAAIRIGETEADVALDNDSLTSLVWS
jgi:glucosylceramidase